MTDTKIYKPLTITHTYAVPREKVWDAWTIPEQFSQWWSPDGFTIPTCDLDVRAGGMAHVVMQSPDGTQFPMEGTYEIVEKPERIIWTNRPLGKGGEQLFEIRQTILFQEQDGKTHLEITAEVVSAGPEADPYLAGMEAGITQALQKLTNVVE